MTADDHGRVSTYTNHRCRCEPCKAAWNAYFQKWKSRQAGKPIPADQHGRYPTYYNYGCRCEKCKAAAAAQQAVYRAARAGTA